MTGWADGILRFNTRHHMWSHRANGWQSKEHESSALALKWTISYFDSCDLFILFSNMIAENLLNTCCLFQRRTCYVWSKANQASQKTKDELCKFNCIHFICSRFRTICGQGMRLAALWLPPACCHEIRPPVWHLTPIHPGQILATRASQTTRISSATCPSIIFSLTRCFLGQPMDTLLKPNQSLKGGPPALQFYGWKPKSMLPIFLGPCNIAVPSLNFFFFNSKLKPFLFPIFKGNNNKLLCVEC